MNNITLIIIVITSVFSWKGIQDVIFFNKYLLKVRSVVTDKEYYRMISSGFLHVDFTHLFFNMLTLYFFASPVIAKIGEINFLVLYFISLIAGNLLALKFHEKNGNYSAVGASGAVSGVVFACIVLIPGMSLYIFPIPINIPGYLYGAFYLLYSIYGMKNNLGNIGHSAHIGGAAAGVLIAIAKDPEVIQTNLLAIVFILLPLGYLSYDLFRKK